jgi:hypothetical protein
MVVDFWLARQPAPAEVVAIEILAGGKVIRSVSNQAPERREGRSEGSPEEDEDAGGAVLAPKAGLNRFVWDLRMEEPKLITTRLVFDDWPPAGVRVAPGAYTVRLRVGAATFETKAHVLPNPRVAAATTDLERQAQLLAEIHGRLAETHELVRRIRDLEAQVRDRVERAAQLGKAGALQQAARDLDAKLDGVAEKLWNPELQADEDSLVYTPKLDFQLAALAGVLATADAKPTAAEERRFADLDAQLAALRGELQAIWERDLAAFDRALAAAGVPPPLAAPWR